MPEKMVLVDGNSLMHRAFHALPLLDDGAGVYTNAVFGFLSMLLRVLREEAPDYLGVAFDLHGPTFRHEAYADYKAGRSPTPEELKPQFDVLKEILGAMGVKVLTCPGYEADDILGTFSKKCEQRGIDAVLVTGDRDSFQLAGPRTRVLYTKRGISDTERVTPEYLLEKYGLTPSQMIDLKGLMGDASDNLPGVPGVGEKTALKLLAAYGSLESALAHADADQKGKLRERLMAFADQARFSKQLATIHRDAPVGADFEAMRLGDIALGVPALEKYHLKTLAQRLRETRAGEAATPVLQAQGERVWQKPEACANADAFGQWALARPSGAGFAFALGKDASLAFEDGSQATLALGGDLLSPGADEADAAGALAPLLTGTGRKAVCGVKSLMALLDAPPENAFDVQLAAYAINPGEKSYALSALTASLPEAPERTDAGALWELCVSQEARLKADGVEALYREIELPLAYTLYDMEREGFMVDAAELARLGAIYRAKIQAINERAQALAGTPVNLNSPKQLGELLYGKLGIAPGGKKTTTGFSTNVEALEAIADQHEIIPLILEYRKYAKLNGTYVEALLRMKGPDGRVHTSFDQTATSTGRISSNEPNLQNIPVRTELGREIRSAFIARPGWVLVDADYSQIELRVLAHMAGDPVMREAFRLDQDIHRRTAAEVYGVPLSDVTKEMRSAAKAVNFGIVYGISEFGLARNIGVSRKEAGAFIERYFARYPMIRRFMDDMVTLGKTQGYVTTLFGRRRYLPELQSPSYQTRAFGERAAMNSPIQGTAADIIKVAMNRVHAALREKNLRARLILQVHDELIVEAPEAERGEVMTLLRGCMEGAAELSVPLKADLTAGGNWNECK